MPFIKTNNNIEWHYEIEGEGEVICFLHGWGVNGRIWRQQAKYFSKSYTVLTIDLPGHGKSTWQSVSLADMANNINAVMEKLNLKEAHFVSSSFGGLLALKICDVFPEKIKSLVFVGSQPKFSKSKDYPFGLDVDRIRKLAGQLETDYPSIINIFFRSLFTKTERQTRRFKWIQKFRKVDDMPDKTALLQYLDILEKEDLRNIMEKVSFPVQFINGTEDHICPPKLLNYLRDKIPHARFDWFHHCGHFPFLSKPYEFNQILEEFLVGQQ